MTTYQYNGFGERIAEKAPEIGTTNITRDAMGNPLLIKDAKSSTTQISYDLLNRPTSKVIKNSSGTVIDTFTYTYDTPKGYLSSIKNNTGTLAYTWASTGELLTQAQTVDGMVLKTSWIYDGAGRPTQQTLPSGNQINMTYQPTTGLLATLTVKNPTETFSRTIITSPRYAPFGELQGWTWGNGRPHLEQRDLTGKTIQVLDRHTEALQYNGKSQIISRSDLNPSSQFIPIGSGDQFSYTFDAFDQLHIHTLNRNGTASTQVQNWSPNENRVDPNTTFYAQSGSPAVYTTQQWLQQNAQAAMYDATGNLIKLGTRGYGYNSLNQLTSVSDGTTVKGTYNYGPDGFRVKKVANGKTLQLMYLPSGELMGEYQPITGGYHVDREHIYLNGKPVAVLSDGGRSNVTTTQAVAPMDLNYVHTDVIGTPRKITHADTGNLVWTWLQDDPNEGNAPITTNGIVYNLRYAGQYFDAETGLHENRYRFYDPKTGRYLTPDPIGLGGGMHRYNYVNGDPVNKVDPLGLAAVIAPAALEGLGGAVIEGIGFVGSAVVAGKIGSDVINASKDKCENSDCPPCRTVSGRVVSVGTIGYRLDLVPPSKPHYPYKGNHYNFYKANQSPSPKCICFWQSIGAGDASGGMPPPVGSIPIEPFIK